MECNILLFIENEDGPTNVRWEAWKDQFLAYMALKRINAHDEMFNALQCFGGPDIRKVIKTCGENAVEKIYLKLLWKFWTIILHQKCHYERIVFGKCCSILKKS